MAAKILRLLKHVFLKSTKRKFGGGGAIPFGFPSQFFGSYRSTHTANPFNRWSRTCIIFVIVWHKAFDNVLDQINADSKEYCYRLP